jgi:hypothetical protein
MKNVIPLLFDGKREIITNFISFIRIGKKYKSITSTAKAIQNEYQKFMPIMIRCFFVRAADNKLE